MTSQEDVPWRGADGHPGQGYILGEELESTDEQRVGRHRYRNRHHVPSWVGCGSGGAGSRSGLAYSHGLRSRWKQDLRGPTSTLQPIDKLPPSLDPQGLGLGLRWPQGWVCVALSPEAGEGGSSILGGLEAGAWAMLDSSTQFPPPGGVLQGSPSDRRGDRGTGTDLPDKTRDPPREPCPAQRPGT